MDHKLDYFPLVAANHLLFQRFSFHWYILYMDTNMEVRADKPGIVAALAVG